MLAHAGGGQLGQGELSRLGCWLGRELAVAGARWQRLSRAWESVPVGLVDLPGAAAGRPRVGGEQVWLAAQRPDRHLGRGDPQLDSDAGPDLAPGDRIAAGLKAHQAV